MKVFADVAMELSAGQRELYLNIARLLKERFGARIHLYVRTKEEVLSLQRHTPPADRVWDSLSRSNPVSDAINADSIDEAEVFAQARHYEAATGMTLNTFVSAQRQLNRGYSIGGYAYPRLRKFKTASYARQANAVVAGLRFWDAEIAGRGITLLVDGTAEGAAMANLHGISYRRLHHGRYQNRYFWSPDIYQSNPALESAFANTKKGVPVRLDGSPAAARTKIDAYVRGIGALGSLRDVPPRVLRWALMRLLGYEAARNSMSLSIILRGPFEKGREFRRLMKLASVTVADLKGRSYAYFPLQKEPEIAISQAAPELPPQHSLIIAASRQLPAGTLLAVKEHLVSIRSRPRGFYEQVTSLPNVVLLNPFEDSIEAIRHAAVTLASFGSAGFEAALMGKPVVTFTGRVPWSILAHVHTAALETQLPEFLRRAVAGELDREKAERDGERLLAALIETTFDLGEFGADRSATRGATPERALIAMEGLVGSFATRKAPRKPSAKSQGAKRRAAARKGVGDAAAEQAHG